MSCVVLFGVSSILCGLAPTLPLLLFFRVLQGIGGGGLAPSEQAILADTFPPEKRGQAFAVYGLAVVTAPVLGPTLGGWIVDNYDWRWIFFINVPVALVSLFLTSRLVEDPPHVTQEVERVKREGFRMDGLGFGFVALAFGCLEVVLDKGQEDDWLNSDFIRVFLVLVVIGFVGMITWELYIARKGRKPIIDLRLFRNRTFALSFAMMLLVGFALYGANIAMPQILQQLMGYTAGGAGEALSTGGLATILMMPLVGFLMGKVDPRKLVVCGYLMLGCGLFYVGQIYLGVSFAWVAKARFFQSLGLGFLFIPISTLAYVGTRPEQSNDVSGMTNLARNVGGSIGTSFVTTFAARWAQTHQAYLARHVNNGNMAWVGRLNALTQQSKGTFAATADAQHRAMAQFYQQSLQSQASILAYKDITHFFAYAMFVMAPLALLMKRPPKGTSAAAH